MARQGKKGRGFWRWAGVILKWVALALAGTILAMVVSLQIPAVRDLIRRQVNDVLLTTFTGRVFIEKIGRLSITGVGGVRARIEDPRGTLLLLVEDANVEVATFSTVRSLLSKEGDFVIDITSVKLDYVDVNLDADEDGNLKLVEAFAPPEVKPEEPPSPRATVVHLRKILLRHGWVHGQPGPLVDADLDRLDLSLIVGGDRTVADLATIEIAARAPAQAAGLRAQLEAHYAKPGPNGTEQTGRADFKGELGEASVIAHGFIDGPDVEATLDVPKIDAANGKRFLPGLTLAHNVAAHAWVRGRLPELRAGVHVGSGRGALEIDASATIAEEKKVHAVVKARDMDAHAFVQTAPMTRVGLDATVDAVVRADGTGSGTLLLEILPGEAAKNAIPATHLSAEMKLARPPEGETLVSVGGRADIEEPGAPTTLRFGLEQRAGVSTIAFRVNSVAGRLDRTRVGNQVSGSATIDVEGSVAIGETIAVDAGIDLRASRIAMTDARFDRLWLQGKVHGPIADPMLDVRLRADRVAAADMQFSQATVTVRGSRESADVTAVLIPTDGPRVDARTNLSLGEVIGLRDARLSVVRNDVNAVLQIATARIAGDDIRVEGVTLEGVGEPLHAELFQTKRQLAIRASSDGLDLAKVGRLLHSGEFRGGQVTLDVDLAVRANGATGYVRADVADGAFARVKSAKANVDARIDGRRIDAAVRADLGDVGYLNIEDCHLELDGTKQLTAKSLERARGKLAIDSNVNMSRLRTLLPRGTLPFTEMEGVFRLKGDVSRSSADDVPEIHLAATTRGLLLSGRGEREQVDGVRVADTPPWRIEGVDVEIAATVARDDGATTVKGRLLDRQGTVVSLDVNAGSMPYRQWLVTKTVDPKRLNDLRWMGRIEVPRRELKRFPSFLKTQQMGGTLAVNASFDGSLATPDIRLLLEANQWSTPVVRGMQPINAKVDAHYQQGEGAVDVAIGSQDKKLLAGTVELKGSLPGFAPSAREPSGPWRASTKFELAEFPLETLAAFSDLQMKGFVSGELTVDGLHEDARAKAKIALRALKLGRAEFPQGHLSAEFDGQSLRGALHLNQKDGFLKAETQLGMTWGANTAPAIAPDTPAFATLKANQFRAAAILPFASSVVSALDGRINADARVDFAPGGGPPKMQGNIALERGRMQLARLGEPLHGVTLRVAVTPDGVIKLDDLTAHGSTGKLNAKGVVRLNGLDLVAARLNVRIPKSDPFPVDIDGQAVGEIDADINIAADMTPDKRALNVKVDIPRLHTELPESSNKPQELGEAEKIRVGYFRRPRQFVILPKDAEDLKDEDEEAPPEKEPTATTITVHLGNDVEIRKGTMLRVALTGTPKIEITDEVKMSGQIQLTRGVLEVQGKRFRIEKGTVTFVDEPDNPQILVTAMWKAPDGTRVYADFVGPLKTGKVKLRSEPSRPQNEIVALIMFGTAEGSSSTPYPSRQPDGTTRATAVAGGFATEGLSKGLDKLTGLDVQTRIDTSSSANPRPEIEVQVAKDISVQLGYVLGTPAPGTNPDRTWVTLDYRFKRNWSMETTFGNQGSSIVDFLWQYRY
jgi:translocation and assembly module TamB